ncbi:transporter, major facilitator family protein [Ancylostoma duodenale]|uniref:Transporter, major facilitator family protein n=1 Tax=Ancylostoma duodenale TaxID=51022 RepID=A0A0C2GZB6_9BILA|nr:transporter, major facilitator family protein [Ancylostoma duodenale]
MGFNVPLLNRDSDAVRAATKQWIDQPQNQKKLVLVIVSVALLLDNMLYMVIVPIIPKYLRDIHAYAVEFYGYHNETERLPNGTVIVRAVGAKIDYKDEDIELGWLFASKALIQIFVNPFSGYIIDRVGYEIPMGFGSAFADTSGLAMIADRFSEEGERSAALGIALAFISFGCLVAPPFGSVLYSLAGKPVPFLILSFVCLADALAVFMVIQPGRRGPTNAAGERVKGTPMWRLFMDPMIAVCSGALIMANVSLAFLEPTITNWMAESMPDTPVWLVGMIWLPAFFPHVLGLSPITHGPSPLWGWPWRASPAFAVPYTTSVMQLIIPLSFVCFGIALIDTSLLPMLGHLVDTRHVPVYGSVYAIADISYSLAYAFGPIIAGWIVGTMGFFALNLFIFLSNVIYTPVIFILKNVHEYDSLAPKNGDDVTEKRQLWRN